MDGIELPAGWQLKKIGDAAPIDNEVVLPTQYPDRLFQYVALENIESGTGRVVGLKPTEGSSIKSNKFLFSKNHVLFGKLRPYLNKVVVPDFEGICSTDILPLRPKPGVITREFLSLFLRSSTFIEYTKSMMEGTKMPRLRTPDLESYEIPVPPMDEQRRIVARVEELTRRVGEARELRKQATDEINIASKTVSKKFFDQNDIDESGTALGEVTTRITKGESPRWQGFQYQNDGPTFVRSENVLWGFLDLSKRTHIPKEFHRKLNRSQLRSGDVLVNLVGASIGRACIVPDEIGEANVNQAVAVVSLNAKALLNRYLLHFLLSPAGQHSIHGGEVQSAQPNISLTDLATLKVPLPSLGEQQSIVDHLDSFQSRLDGLRCLQSETEAELAKFTPALLAKAFRGELQAWLFEGGGFCRTFSLYSQ